MAFYSSSQQVCEVMSDLFQRTINNPTALKELRNAGMILRLDISDPPAIITLNGKSNPPTFSCGASNLHPDLTLHTRMDVIHQVWTSQIRLRDAFFGGQIKVDGSTLRAMTLGGLFRQIEALYPSVLRDRGLNARA